MTEGHALYTLEKAPFEAAVDEARGILARIEAQLKEAEKEFHRTQNLEKRGYAAQNKLDDAVAARDSLRADQISAKARLEQAKINLAYTEIDAPISGRIGESHYSKGDLVTPTSGFMARIIQLDPIRVVFSIDESAFLKYSKGFFPNTKISLLLANGKKYAHPGQIEFMDNQIDPQTGTLAVRARFPNPEKSLLPGQSVKVLIEKTSQKNRLTIPQKALQHDHAGPFVLTVTPDGAVHRKQVIIDHQFKDRWVIKGNLSSQDRLIVEGFQNLRPHTKVNAVENNPLQNE